MYSTRYTRFFIYILGLLFGSLYADISLAVDAVNKPSVISSISLIKVFLSLLLVLAFIAVMAWASRRLDRFKRLSNDTLKVEKTLSLGSKEKLVLIKVENKSLLIGVTANSINTLMELKHTVTEDHSDRHAEMEPQSSEINAQTLVSLFRKKTVSGD